MNIEDDHDLSANKIMFFWSNRQTNKYMDRPDVDSCLNQQGEVDFISGQVFEQIERTENLHPGLYWDRQVVCEGRNHSILHLADAQITPECLILFVVIYKDKCATFAKLEISILDQRNNILRSTEEAVRGHQYSPRPSI